MMNIRRAKVALVAFVMFLIALVVMADTGRGRWLFSVAGVVPAGDKLGHVLLFGILSFLANLLARGRTFPLLGFRVLAWSAILMLLASLEEVSQVFFRSRTFDWLDLVSDALGIWLFGRLAVAYLDRKRRVVPTSSTAEALE